MPFCPNCEKSIGEEDRFCRSCGQTLQGLTIQKPITQAPSVPENRRIWLILFAFILVFSVPQFLIWAYEANKYGYLGEEASGWLVLFGMMAPVILIIILFLILTEHRSKHYWRKREQNLSSLFEIWKKDAVEMGFSEVPDQYGGFLYEQVEWSEGWGKNANVWGENLFELYYTPFKGNYRGHSVQICPEWDKTRYEVEFVNPEIILVHLERKKTHILPSFFHRMSMDDPEFDQEFRLSGNKEANIKAAFNPNIRNRLMVLKDTFYELTNMHDRYAIWGRYQLRYKRNPKLISYTDDRRIEDNTSDPKKLKLIIDVIIDIVEKIEGDNREFREWLSKVRGL